MGRPVVASAQAFEGVAAQPGRDLLVAEGAEAMAEAVGAVLAGRHPGLPGAARAAMEASYAWAAALARLDDLMDSIGALRDKAAAPPAPRATTPTEATP